MKSNNETKLKQIPRVAAIHDLSGFGRCALTVVIPVLSAMGVQVVPLPTALLSTHTGGFTDMHIRNLSSDMTAIYKHWYKLGVKFDAIYSGFTLNLEQADIIKSFRGLFTRPETLVLTDPVFGDDGKLYSTCTTKTVEYMKNLCRGSDVITPNLTEACMMCGEHFPNKSLSFEKAHNLSASLLLKLEELEAKNIVITGIKAERDGKLYMLNCGVDEKGYFETIHPRMPSSFPGTGELFASILLGSLLGGASLRSSCEKAASLTVRIIQKTATYGTPEREGVALEACLNMLML